MKSLKKYKTWYLSQFSSFPFIFKMSNDLLIIMIMMTCKKKKKKKIPCLQVNPYVIYILNSCNFLKTFYSYDPLVFFFFHVFMI